MLNQSDSYISFKCISKSKNVEKNNLSEIDRLSDFINSKDVLHSYLRLNVDLNNYYKIWSESDPHFKKAASQLHGVRILNQEVTENLFSFICSSNNNIKRFDCTLIFQNDETIIFKKLKKIVFSKGFHRWLKSYVNSMEIT